MAKVNPWKITGYKAGQNVVCKVSHAEPGGYAVIIPKDNLPGFLPTEQPLKAGEEVLAQFVCVSNSRILLQCRFGTNTKPGAARQQSVNWEEQLNQIDGKPTEKIDYGRPGVASAQPAALDGFDPGVNYAQSYEQPAYSQDPYAQDQHAQNSYEQDPYADQYAADYAETQSAQTEYEQPSSTQWQNSDYSQSGGFQNNAQPGYAPSQPSYQAPQAPAGYEQSYQGVQGQPDYSKQQNMQFNPQLSGNQAPSFGATGTGGMQFKPQMPADYVETETHWGAPPNLGQPQPLSAPPVTPQANQNTCQAPMQTAGGAQAQPPVSYQGPTPGAGGSYQAQQPVGNFQSPSQAQPGQYQNSANQYNSGAQPAESGYQSPASYQGVPQAPAAAPQPVVAAPASAPEVKAAKPVKEALDDDWGYAGQGWDDGVRLTKAPPEPPTGLVPASEADAAFRVWAPTAHTREFHLKRATDLVPPAFDLSSLATFTGEEQDLEWLITDIEGGMRTGCVKAISQSTMSRSAALLYKGRAVGCIYGRKKQPENYGTEQSLQIMMQDLEKSDTEVQLYDLPDNVVLPMSALFLGYPVPREERVDARTYMDYMCNWFASKAQTACLAVTFPSRSATCLCFIYEGNFCGAFYVEEQKFTEDKDFVYELMKTDPQASVEASILPPEMTSSAVRFGFNLSMARKKGY